MPDAMQDELLADFSAAEAYTMQAPAGAPSLPGVHVLMDHGVVVYVGWTGNLRRRLRQHLTGNRDSSVLHAQIGQLLDTPEHDATAAEVRLGWASARSGGTRPRFRRS